MNGSQQRERERPIPRKARRRRNSLSLPLTVALLSCISGSPPLRPRHVMMVATESEMTSSSSISSSSSFSSSGRIRTTHTRKRNRLGGGCFLISGRVFRQDLSWASLSLSVSHSFLFLKSASVGKQLQVVVPSPLFWASSPLEGGIMGSPKTAIPVSTISQSMTNGKNNARLPQNASLIAKLLCDEEFIGLKTRLFFPYL